MFESKSSYVLIIIAAVILFFSVNVVGNVLFNRVRIDLTERKIYTLSDGTKNILSKIEEPIIIRLFYSEDTANSIPYIKGYASRVKGLLKQYAGLSKGRIELEFINPEPFSDEEDQAVAFGIQAVPLNNGADKLYFGLVATNSVGESDTISFFEIQKEPLLEYELSRIIYSLDNPERQVVGLMSWIPMEKRALPNQPASQDEWVVLDRIKEQFAFRTLNPNLTAVPDYVDVLMIVHPNNLSDQTLYAIEQFILSGGHALIFVDSYSELQNIQSKESNLKKLFDMWGVDFNSEEVVADQVNALRVNTTTDGTNIKSVRKLNWIHLNNKFMNDNDVVTKELNQVRLASAGNIEKMEGSETEFTPLIHTSNESSLVDKIIITSPENLLEVFNPSNQEFTVAARVSGNVKSAFPDFKDKENHLNESKEPMNVVIFGDTDFLRDIFWVQKRRFLNKVLLLATADNASFVVNTLDNLGGSNDLISLRSRGNVDRPFEVVEDLRMEAEAKFLQEEKRLQLKLQETERKLSELETPSDNESTILIGEAQKMEIEKFRKDIVDTRKQLREVNHALHKDIEGLGSFLKFINIGLIPILIIVVSLVIPKRLGIKKS